MAERQHDDHIWLVFRRQSWAIRGIERSDGVLLFRLWRGYEPDLEFCDAAVTLPHDWGPYCATAARLLEAEP